MVMILFLLLNLLMLTAANTAAYTYFKDGHFSRQLVTVFLLYVSQVTFSVLFLGVVVRNLSMPAILLLNSAISLLVIAIYRKSLEGSLIGFWRKWAVFARFLVKSRDYFLYFFLLLFGVQVVLLLIKIYTLPPSVWDVFTYHLHPVIEWYQRDMIPLIFDTPVIRANYKSLGSGLGQFWVLKGTGNLTWTALPQFVYGLMLLTASYALMIRLEVPSGRALRYALLIYFIPAVLQQSATGQNHLTLTSLIVMALLYFLDVFFRKQRSSLFFLALSMGLLLGTKLNSPQIILIFFLALPLSRGFNAKKIIAFLRENKITLLTGTTAALLLGGFWHIRNIIIYKNLLGAFVSDVSGGGTIWTTLGNVAETFFKNIKAFPFRITDVTTHYTPDLNSISGFGIQFFVFGTVAYFLAVVFLLIKKNRRAGMTGYTALFSMLLLLSYFAYYYTSFNYRLFMFFPVLGLVLWAALMKEMTPSAKHLVYLDVLLAVMLLFNMMTNHYPGHVYRETFDWKTRFKVKSSTDEMPQKWKTLFTTDHAPDRTPLKYFPYITRGVPNHWGFIDDYIPTDEPIGYMGEPDSWILPYFDNEAERRIHYLPSLAGFKLTGKKNNKIELSLRFKESLKQRNIHFIHINVKKNPPVIKDGDVITVSRYLYYYDWTKPH